MWAQILLTLSAWDAVSSVLRLFWISQSTLAALPTNLCFMLLFYFWSRRFFMASGWLVVHPYAGFGFHSWGRFCQPRCQRCPRCGWQRPLHSADCLPIPIRRAPPGERGRNGPAVRPRHRLFRAEDLHGDKLLVAWFPPPPEAHAWFPRSPDPRPLDLPKLQASLLPFPSPSPWENSVSVARYCSIRSVCRPRAGSVLFF